MALGAERFFDQLEVGGRRRQADGVVPGGAGGFDERQVGDAVLAEEALQVALEMCGRGLRARTEKVPKISAGGRFSHRLPRYSMATNTNHTPPKKCQY